jgi:hypothetical protein
MLPSLITRFDMKEYPLTIKLEEIWSLLQGIPTAHLATIDNSQPRVRPMGLIITMIQFGYPVRLIGQR